jgi:uncharacterized MnhB-related membrane protein
MNHNDNQTIKLFLTILIIENLFLAFYFLLQVFYYKSSIYLSFLGVLAAACGWISVVLYNKHARKKL